MVKRPKFISKTCGMVLLFSFFSEYFRKTKFKEYSANSKHFKNKKKKKKEADCQIVNQVVPF
jgi:UPF0716 family protein affecting phage T7 exclusion